jgi:soluble lytic murein transglycosylase
MSGEVWDMEIPRLWALPQHILVIMVALAIAATQVPLSSAPLTMPEHAQLVDNRRSALEHGRQTAQTSDRTAEVDATRPRVESPDSQGDAEARLAHGEALLNAGQARQAIDAFSALRAAHPETTQAELSLFLSARAWDALGEHTQAIDSYRAYAAHDPQIAPYLGLLIAERLAHTGRLDEAETQAAAVANEPVIRRTAVAALEQIREIQKQQQDNTGFVATTTRLLELATIPDFRAALMVERARVASDLGQRDAAVADLREVLTIMPDNPVAAEALAALQALGADGQLSPEARGRALYHSGQHEAAIALLDQAITMDPNNDTAAYFLAMSRLEAGDQAAAVDELRALADRFAKSPIAPLALARAGRWYEEHGRVDDARRAYASLVQRYPTADDAPEAQFRLGLLAYRHGEFAVAAAWSATSAEAPFAGRAALWLGKARERLGDRDGARAAWEAAVARDPGGPYGLRARDLLAGERRAVADPRPLDAGALALTPEDRRQLDEWLRSFETDVAAARASVENDPGYQRAVKLLRLGLQTEAGWEINELVDRYGDNPPRLASLASLLAGQGRVDHSVRVAESAVESAQRFSTEVPRAVMRLAYPIPYSDLVLSAAERWDLDPLLFMSLVRQESSFNPSARSPADARGLAQIVPATGQSIAERLGWTTWHPDNLFDPAVSIDFGMAHLAGELGRYDGRLFLALAAYNAGSGAVADWLSQPGSDDPEIFAEQIPYPETRDYVERVYENYAHYQRLYRPKPSTE